MKPDSCLKIIGNNIKMARLQKHMTQETLAEKCNISSKHISAIERGITAGSTLLIMNICNILEVTPNYIFNGTITDSKDSISVLPDNISTAYLKLKDDSKKFINDIVLHLYSIQKQR